MDALKAKAKARPFLTVMFVALVVGGIYYGLIAAPLYASTSRFAIRSKIPTTPAAVTITQALSSPTVAVADLNMVSDFINSPGMLDELERRHHLKRDYSTPRLDLFRRLPANASREDFLAFYRKQVVIRIDREGGMIEAEVRAFDPKTALAVSNSILELSEAFENNLSERMRVESTRSAAQVLAQAEEEANAARLAQTSFRIANDDIDPAATGAQTQGGVATLTGQVNDARAELASLLTYSRPNAPAVQQLTAKIGELNRQIAQLRARQGGGGDGGNLSVRVGQYEVLVTQREAAEAKLKAAQTGYQLARNESEQRERYVVRVVQPNLPDEPTRPRRLFDLLVVLIFVATAYALTMLIVAGVRDHHGA